MNDPKQQSLSLIAKFDDGVRGPSPKYVQQEQQILSGEVSGRNRYMNAIDETRKAGIKPAAPGASREEFDARAATIMAVNNRLNNEQRPSVASGNDAAMKQQQEMADFQK